MALGPVHLFNVEHGVETPAVAGTRAYLESLGHGELVDLVLEIATSSPGVRDRLEMRAVAGAGGEVDLAALRALIDRALRVNGFVEYGQARGYAEAVEHVADALGEQGMDRYREELSRIRSERPKEDWSSHYLMTEFARVTGDTDLLVEAYASEGTGCTTRGSWTPCTRRAAGTRPCAERAKAWRRASVEWTSGSWTTRSAPTVRTAGRRRSGG
ncbi:hypothetical protein [Nocardiopsis lambiniae]|uniref:Uncharacterized protein n=1 Tax=Nocardiopsis lambiniae TaxID=3075539 RepID=A0ABU2MBE3_9ACTN|nr:hypothetical protein [Nocardiopsis sp. DSM 44743]MDT0330002.1 hypothetical protein [Nocardiopsis sp. DSM 44743]